MKTYKRPSILIVKLQSTQHLMEVSGGGTSSISSDRYTDDDGFVKSEGSSRYNVWDDDWSK